MTGSARRRARRHRPGRERVSLQTWPVAELASCREVSPGSLRQRERRGLAGSRRRAAGPYRDSLHRHSRPRLCDSSGIRCLLAATALAAAPRALVNWACLASRIVAASRETTALCRRTLASQALRRCLVHPGRNAAGYPGQPKADMPTARPASPRRCWLPDWLAPNLPYRKIWPDLRRVYPPWVRACLRCKRSHWAPSDAVQCHLPALLCQAA